MLLKKLSLLITILSLVACGASKKVEPGGNWSGTNYIHYCPTYCFSLKAKVTTTPSVLNPNNISLATSEFPEALKIATNYIKNKSSKSFFANVTFYDADVTYTDSIANFKNKSPRYNLEKCGDIKYYFRFKYQYKEAVYRFGVALTNTLTVVPENNFPTVNNTEDFSKIISPHKALNLAKKFSNNTTTPFTKMHLDYNTNINGFVWLLNTENKVVLDSTSVKNTYVILNAVTGTLLNKGETTSPVMIDPRFF